MIVLSSNHVRCSIKNLVVYNRLDREAYSNPKLHLNAIPMPLHSSWMVFVFGSVVFARSSSTAFLFKEEHLFANYYTKGGQQ